MLNQVVLVGRLTKDPELEIKDDGKKLSSVVVAVQRPFKNSEGMYETDFVRCSLWNAAAENTTEYCKTGDMIGIKGRIQTDKYEDSDGKLHYVTEVVAERITFISSKKEVIENTSK
ncbi:MAG: single-stranded DNA-binding protein [Bacilli bacterium]|nr:single-stranded DNA-binding protein [Bacilli bacterium]